MQVVQLGFKFGDLRVTLALILGADSVLVPLVLLGRVRRDQARRGPVANTSNPQRRAQVR